METVPTITQRQRSIEWEALDADPGQVAWALTRELELSFVGAYAAAMIAGRPASELTGRSLRDVVPSAFAERMAAMFELVSTTRSRALGSALWNGKRVRSTYVPSCDATGSVTEMLVITRLAPLGVGAMPEVDEADYIDLGDLDHLSARELEVLAYFGQGMRAADVAARIHRSVKTIRRFQSELTRKLGIEGRCGLSLFARDIGLRPHHAGLRRL